MRAIFSKDFNYTSRRVNAGWSAKASPKVQSFPTEFVEAAIAAGRAEAEKAKKSIKEK